MLRYADPTVCPDCRAPLPPAPAVCPRCDLPLRGPVAADLLSTLTRADLLLERLRAEAPVLVGATGASAAGGAVDGGRAGSPAGREAGAAGRAGLLDGVGPLPRADRADTVPGGTDERATGRATGRGLPAWSVPRLLLGLGALCLLVAAVVFLAVTWSALGVGGRTLTLLGLTVAAGVTADRLARRGLRVGAESLTVVALGLVVLDAVGALSAGWLGTVGLAGALLACGAALLAGGVVVVLARTDLVAAQLAVPVGLGLVGGALLADGGDPRLVGALLVLAHAAVRTALRLLPGEPVPARALPGAALVGATAWWGLLLLASLGEAADHASLTGLWTTTHGPALLVTAALALLPVVWSPARTTGASTGAPGGAPLGSVATADTAADTAAGGVAPVVGGTSRRGHAGRSAHPDHADHPGHPGHRPTRLHTCVVLAGALASLALVLPALDEGPTGVTVGAGVVCVAWALAARGVPAPWRVAVTVPAVVAAAPVAVTAAVLAAAAVVRLLAVGEPLSRSVGVRLSGELPAPAWLVLPSALALGVLAATLTRPGPRLDGARDLTRTLRAPALRRAAAAVALLAAVLVALTSAPLAGVVLLLCVAGGLLALPVARDTDVGLGLLVLAVLAALPSAALGAVAALAALGVSLVAAHRRPAAPSLVVLTAAAGWAAWSGGDAAGLGATTLGPAVVVVVGALALWRARPVVELTALATAVLASVAAVDAAAAAAGRDGAGSTYDAAAALALHLTLVGALVVAAALLRVERRPAGWLGGALLTAASWVRLADTGVTQPEAYALPAALALLVLGALRLRRDPAASTRSALGGGLLLATVPSLLRVLVDDPVSPRALVLGLACLGLVLLGARLRLAAPLVVGAVVGGVLVLAEAAPWAAQTPQWVLLGLIGTLLTVVGVTWERRLAQVRAGSAYLARLR
ncbi:SCO7613 C-terminal domain-containing membrane protein [Nocardioides kribbensis]|uniref:SCO7613 C-terminal domain-containing membrane protein n=1 Tax=Nocardioides kribbensis TaxID=305517 RepID=UPI0032DA6924